MPLNPGTALYRGEAALRFLLGINTRIVPIILHYSVPLSASASIPFAFITVVNFRNSASRVAIMPES